MSYIGVPPTNSIASGQVGSEEIQDASVAEADIANNAVAFAKIKSTDIADQTEAEAGLSAVKLMTPQRTLQAITNYYENTILDSYTAGVDFTAGTTQVLTPSTTPGSVNNIFIFFDGVYQAKNTFTIDSNGDIAFTTVIPIDVENVDIIYAILSATGVPSDGSITISKLASGLLANESEAIAGTSDTKLMTPLSVRQSVPVRILGHGYAFTGTRTTTTNTIPLTTAIPTSSNGAEVLTLDYTPKSATSTLRIWYGGYITHSAAQANNSAFLLKNSETDAFHATIFFGSDNSNPEGYQGYTEIASDSTDPLTIKLHAGSNDAGTSYINGGVSTNYFGGIVGSYIKIEEIE